MTRVYTAPAASLTNPAITWQDRKRWAWAMSVVWPLLFRFVRHLPVRRHGAACGTDLRAGVGQTSGEETAGHAAVLRSRCGSMAIVAPCRLRMWPG